MSCSSVRSFLVAIALALTCIGASYPTNSLITQSQLQAAINDGTLRAGSASCGSSSTQVASRATIIGCIANTGGCNAGGNGDYVMTWGDIVACRVTATATSKSFSGSAMSATQNAVCTGQADRQTCNGPYNAVPYAVASGGAVAPTTSSVAISASWSASGTCSTYSLTNPSGTSVASGSVSVGSTSYYSSSASAGTYTLTFNSTTQSSIRATCTISSGTLTWYQ